MPNCNSKTRFPLFLALTSLLLCFSASSAEARPRSIQDLDNIASNLIDTSVAYGSIPSLYRPEYVRVGAADLSTDYNDQVFVVLFPEGPRIYPQRIMVWHQVVNEVIDDVAYVITYSPITGSMAAYRSTMGGSNLILDSQGKLYEGNDVLIDRNTGSLWLQIFGLSFEGPLRGRGLVTLPVFWTTWRAASRFFPDAPVLAVPKDAGKAYARDPYGSYLRKDSYYYNDRLIYPVKRIDKRLPHKNPILGLEIDNALLAVDINYVKKNGTVNFFLGPNPLLAVHDRTLDVVRIYDRQIWEKPSLFVYSNGQLLDLATRTQWNPSTGKAIRGSMDGAGMKEYFGVYAMWFSWYSINPETYLVPGPGEVDKKFLQLKPMGQ